MRGPALIAVVMMAVAAVGAATPDGAVLREPEAIVGTGRARSVALFQEVSKVLQHPRCVNCHPRGDRPLQGDGQRLHLPAVVRGADGRGAEGLRCTSCHGDANFDPGRVPGHDDWHLAPKSMAWEGRSPGEICRQLLDRRRNGGRSLDQIVRHMAEDGLVGWAWHPGEGRTPAPGSQEQFGRLIRAWAESGAACPR